MSIQSDLEATVGKVAADSLVLHAIIHGPAFGSGSTVVTDGGPVRTLAGAIADLEAAFAAAGIIVQVSDAVTATTAAAGTAAGAAGAANTSATLADISAKSAAVASNDAKAAATAARAASAQNQFIGFYYDDAHDFLHCDIEVGPAAISIGASALGLAFEEWRLGNTVMSVSMDDKTEIHLTA